MPNRKQSTKAALARAAMSAVEPLIELLLELGISSPEAESLLRSIFVHKTRDWLASRDPDGRQPSDARIALVSGVHRNFVHRILAEPPGIARTREQRGTQAERLLLAWHTDPRYLDSSGKPRDLSERDQEPSFYSLASNHMPGAAPGVILEELRRAGAVQLLPDRRVRVRSRFIRLSGVNLSSVSDLGERSKEVLETLIRNLQQPDRPLYCNALTGVEVDEKRLAAVHDLINRRAGTFLDAMEQELAAESARFPRRGRRGVRVGVGVYSSERGPQR